MGHFRRNEMELRPSGHPQQAEKRSSVRRRSRRTVPYPWGGCVERSQDRRTAKGIDLSCELGAAAIGTLGQAFRLDGAVQQSSILGRELSDLALHIVNYGTVFSYPLLRAVEVIRRRCTHSRVSKFVEDVAMVGVNGIARDAGLTGKRGDRQSMD
jgi:hypothetical protein